MRKAVDYLRTHPVVAIAIVVGLVGIYILLPRSEPAVVTTPATLPAATPGAPVPPGVQPAPVAPTPAPTPTPRVVAGPVDAGRADPFAPLVTVVTGGGGQPSGVPLPPPAPLPPPLFPGQQQPQPGAPGAPATPAPPPKLASTAEVIGIMGESGNVAIIRVGGKTYVVSPGDVILEKIKVTVVDFARGVVVLEEDGEQFQLKLGGVSGAHVAASSHIN
ncbi:MAG: hypothetical protein ACT4P5_03190 [Armatimonadota bacterium]